MTTNSTPAWAPWLLWLVACSSAEPTSSATGNASGAGTVLPPQGNLPGGGGSANPAIPPPSGGGSTGEGPPGNVGPIDNPPATGAGGSSSNPPGAGGTTAEPPPTNEVYVGENGLDSNPGTLAAPLGTLNRAQLFARAGFTIWVLPGTLRYGASQILTVSGAVDNPVRLFAAPGARPAIDFAAQPRNDNGQRGIDLRGHFWHVRGLEIRNAADNGAIISGSNNLIEDVIFHHNGDTGLQIMASEAQAYDNSLAANNTVINCDSFENFDPATDGENADGFAAKLRIGPGNVFRGCRAWNNADDGWDFFAADDVVTIEDSWAFLNGIIAGGGNSAGDGNGFKLGGEPNGTGQGHAPHVVRGGAAFDNRECGFTINNNDETPVLSDCGVGDNNNDYCGLSCDGDSDVNISGAQAITRARNADGSLPSIR